MEKTKFTKEYFDKQAKELENALRSIGCCNINVAFDKEQKREAEERNKTKKGSK